MVGDDARFIKENDNVKILHREGTPFLIELPTHVILEVTETEPGFGGDTAQGATKPAKLETGSEVAVPLFIDAGDKLKIDTRTCSYIERA